MYDQNCRGEHCRDKTDPGLHLFLVHLTRAPYLPWKIALFSCVCPALYFLSVSDICDRLSIFITLIHSIKCYQNGQHDPRRIAEKHPGGFIFTPLALRILCRSFLSLRPLGLCVCEREWALQARARACVCVSLCVWVCRQLAGMHGYRQS